LTPHLVVKAGPAGGVAEYIDFLKRAFNAVEVARMPGPGGKIMHGMVRIDDSMLMLVDDFATEFGLPPLAEGRQAFVLHVYSKDVDADWKQVIGAGATEVMPLADQFWGDRYGQVRDPFGFVWSLATQKEDLTVEEVTERQAKAFSGAH
jgi:PhnB protein